MKVRRICCTQFAGLNEKSLSLEDGINILYGKNESGKSTFVHLLSRTLFQNAKLDKRTDRDFRQLYFPAPHADHRTPGDFIDGSVTLETADGLYTLRKEWGEDPRCTLSTPDAILRSPQQIDETLRRILEYGEGVYGEILLSSQRNTLPALSALLDPGSKSDARTEILTAVTDAFAETGALSVDAIGQAIQEKTEAIAGKHWDAEAGKPQRKAGSGRWASGLGEILKAYYEREDARFALSEVHRLEEERDGAQKHCTEAEHLLKRAEEAYTAFAAYAGKLALQKERKINLQASEQECNRICAILQNWPRMEQEYTLAASLQREQQERALLDTCTAAQALQTEIEALRALLENAPAPVPEEIQQLKRSQTRIRQLENTLCGMNLAALLRLEEGHTAEIRSLRTGERIPLSAGTASLTEAVRITVPGVLDLVLSPADVDTDAVQQELHALRAASEKILCRYKSDSAEALEEMLRQRLETQRTLSLREERLHLLLGEQNYDELLRRTSEITHQPRSSEEIRAEIHTLTPDGNIARFLAARDTVLSGYRQEYTSPEDLLRKCEALQKQIDGLRTLLQPEGDIPELYRRIDDPEQYLRSLRLSAENLRTAREEALRRKAETQTRLETFCQSLKQNPAEEAERAEQAFAQTEELLHHWLHIAAVFAEQKKQMDSSPMKELAEIFLSYLRLLSGGRLLSDFPEKDALQMQILSGDRLIDFAKMSEGTKQTVSLAFRLAVLDQLFPGGGGFLVLDDPLTDMDAERTEQACRLIQVCARRHQILFLTCREEYLSRLSGTILNIH